MVPEEDLMVNRKIHLQAFFVVVLSSCRRTRYPGILDTSNPADACSHDAGVCGTGEERFPIG
jgi:hypothetical protein